jgi:hypothetical protein
MMTKSFVRRIVLLLLTCGALAASSSEAIEAILARWSEEAENAQAAYRLALDKLTTAGVKDAAVLAIARAKKGDIAATSAAWMAVLRFDRRNEDARRFFTALGTLTTVLKRLDDPTADLLGADAAAADDQEVGRLNARFDSGLADAAAHRAEAFAKADKPALRELERLAGRALDQGDGATAKAAWLEALRLKRDHAEARAFFAKIGQLDQTFAGLAKAGDPHEGIMPFPRLGQSLVLRYVCTPANFIQQAGKLLLHDLSGGKHDGLVEGLTERPKTPYLTLNRPDTRVVVGEVSFTKSIPFTVAMWFRPVAPGGPLVGKYVSDSWNGFLLWLELDRVSAWMLRSRTACVGVSEQVSQAEGFRYRPNSWQHVVITVNEGGMTMYANGAKFVSSSWRGQPTETTDTVPLMIGGDFGKAFQGDIGEIAIWKQALGDDEVRTLHALGLKKYAGAP